MRTELTTFGSPLSLRQDADLSQGFALGGWRSQRWEQGVALRAIERDLAVTERRWRGATRTTAGEYLPGDVLRLRALAGTWLVDAATSDWTNHKDGRVEPLADPSREWAALELLYAGVPYFLPASAALGIMASQPPDWSLLAELRLPYPAVAVFFSEAFEVPDGLVGGEERLADQHLAPTTIPDLLKGEESDPRQAPKHIRLATLAAYRRKPLALVGVVLTAGFDGALADLVMFVLAEPQAPKTRFHVVEGCLSQSRLASLVQNLAAAVTWGAWQAPSGFDVPEDSKSPEFRDAVRRGAFRRLEPRGAVGAVRVLDAPRMFQASSVDRDNETLSSSPATHLRRAHWQRYRVGPRDDWRYEARWIPPVIVNPRQGPSRRVTVYRLPTP